ncbi:MAG: alpha/beta hydrolase-fold protein [Prevotella sp.]|nr:alpha/beta hydrolase-fold protein [Bacteroides sp.]MCM1367036.1 alpha/beta hydrolase-fold protein [Prevotella sp.]MCM1437540.1 alpha/beta hydrolase-fold protein [Prevotella sp.]
MRKFCAACSFILASMSALALSPLQHTDKGKIDRINIFSPQLGDTVIIDVWTPADYNPSGNPLPVIYMHDGQNLFDPATTWNHQAWEVDSVADVLSAKNIIKAPVVVGIHSVQETRIGDLTPQGALKYLKVPLDSLKRFATEDQLRGDAYVDFVTNTLRPIINSKYNVAINPENTFVMGSSMGGLMSLYMLCEYPQIYGAAACLSTHWIGDLSDGKYFPQMMLDYIKDKLPRDGKHRIYFDHGTGPYDEAYTPWQLKVNDLCKSLGYDEDNFMTVVDEGATHNENAWKNRLYIPLIFLLSR